MSNRSLAPLRSVGINIPGLGLVIAVVGIYLVGLFVTSFVGKFFMRIVDSVLIKAPAFGDLYKAWKQITLNPPGSTGIYTKVVLVPDESGKLRMLAFCSGTPVVPGSTIYCVFIPSSPNPIGGRVAFVDEGEMITLDMGIEEAFKVLLSSGNYVPAEVVRDEIARGTPKTVMSLGPRRE
ncbi:MAG: DUF502 domain-containing protein [Tepidisphaeraceae bacterium]